MCFQTLRGLLERLWPSRCVLTARAGLFAKWASALFYVCLLASRPGRQTSFFSAPGSPFFPIRPFPFGFGSPVFIEDPKGMYHNVPFPFHPRRPLKRPPTSSPPPTSSLTSSYPLVFDSGTFYGPFYTSLLFPLKDSPATILAGLTLPERRKGTYAIELTYRSS